LFRLYILNTLLIHSYKHRAETTLMATKCAKRFVKPNNIQFLNGCGYRTKGSPWYDVTRGSGALEYRAKINSGHNVHLSQVITGW
jgi:hypothetical protein